jgi:anaerobic ribonucleoside-triphosphate reductase
MTTCKVCGHYYSDYRDHCAACGCHRVIPFDKTLGYMLVSAEGAEQARQNLRNPTAYNYRRTMK